MPSHESFEHREVAKRQAGALSGSVVTVATDAAATLSALALDTSIPSAAPTFATATISNSPLTSAQANSSSLPPPLSSSTPTTGATATESVIPLGIVISACVGTFVVVAILIFLAVWLYRRSARPRVRHPLSQSRNARSEQDRSRSRLETWHKLEDDKQVEGGWKATYLRTQHGGDNDDVSGMEKFTMFKKPPDSLHSMDRSAESNRIDDKDAFSRYYPALAAQLAGSTDDRTQNGQMPQSDYMGMLEVSRVSPLSWDVEGVGRDSMIANPSSGFRASGAMSPSNIIKGTPRITASPQHRWESAEIIHHDEHGAVHADGGDPFTDHRQDHGRRPSLSNPFFNSQESRAIKGKARSRSPGGASSSVDARNPFADSNTAPPPLPQNQNYGSLSTTPASTSSKDRTMQSLLAALEGSPSKVASAMRSASSSIDQDSTATPSSSYGKESIMNGFPLPPQSLPRYL